jgi:hypothetical protein
MQKPPLAGHHETELIEVDFAYLIVGSILIVGIWWVGHDTTGPVPNPRSTPAKWTALDSLRAIASPWRPCLSVRCGVAHLEAVPQRPPEASALLITKPTVPSISPARKTDRTHFAQGRRPANARIAADDQPAPAFFGLSILQ